LATNYHTIKDADRIFIDLFKLNKEDNIPITDNKIKVEIDRKFFTNFQSEELDVAFMPIAPILQNLSEKNMDIFYKAITPNLIYSLEQAEKLGAIEEVVFFGYPYNLQDKSKNLPIIRRGITATPVWSNFREDPKNETFLIDAGVFPGSNGSPVFIFNQGSYPSGVNINVGIRVVFLGMIKISMQNSGNNQFIGLGEVIKANVILEFIKSKLNIT